MATTTGPAGFCWANAGKPQAIRAVANMMKTAWRNVIVCKAIPRWLEAGAKAEPERLCLVEALFETRRGEIDGNWAERRAPGQPGADGRTQSGRILRAAGGIVHPGQGAEVGEDATAHLDLGGKAQGKRKLDRAAIKKVAAQRIAAVM